MARVSRGDRLSVAGLIALGSQSEGMVAGVHRGELGERIGGSQPGPDTILPPG